MGVPHLWRDRSAVGYFLVQYAQVLGAVERILIHGLIDMPEEDSRGGNHLIGRTGWCTPTEHEIQSRSSA
jgi:hypothetical protein